MSKIKRKEMCSPIVLYLIIGLYEHAYEEETVKYPYSCTYANACIISKNYPAKSSNGIYY